MSENEDLGMADTSGARALDQVTRQAIAQARAVLQEVAVNTGLSLGLRSRASGALTTLAAIAEGTTDDLRDRLLADLKDAHFAAAAELTNWPGRIDDRPPGRDGLLHASLASGGSLCGLPAEALEVLRSRFLVGRINSCPICSSRA